MRLLKTLLLIISSYSVAFAQQNEISIKEISCLDLLKSPFGHDESINSYKSNLPKGTRMQILVRRNQEDENLKPDTIFTFKYKKSTIGVYKTRSNQVFTLGGSIKNKEIELANGVRVGISKDEFQWAFTDLPENPSDTIEVKHNDVNKSLVFYFNSKGKLVKYNYKGAENPK